MNIRKFTEYERDVVKDFYLALSPDDRPSAFAACFAMRPLIDTCKAWI